MKGLVLLLSLVAVANALSLRSEWKMFKIQHGKKYVNDIEDRIRMNIYIKNKYLVNEHNRRFAQGKETYTMALNKFADMSPEEFAVTMLTLNSARSEKLSTGVTFLKPFGADPPSSIDWRALGAVTEVKNQGPCGSCWTFSTTGSLEGQHYRKTNQLVSLSEQNLLDCTREHIRNNCSGGYTTDAYKYIKDNGGIDSESSYPYKGIDTEECQYNPLAAAATVTGYVFIKPGDENELKIAVATVGPIAAALDATNLKGYEGGIVKDEECNADHINHAVLIVGYGTSEDGTDYWLVKNSWGDDWGEQGYFRIIRNRNQCGISEQCTYPLV